MKEPIIVFRESLENFFIDIGNALPNIFLFILLFIVAWIVAKIIKLIIVKFLKVIRLNVLSDKIGINKFLYDGGIHVRVIELIGRLGYWFMLILGLVLISNSFEITAPQDLLSPILGYFPNIILALFILIVGLNLANFLSQFISVSLKDMDESTAKLITKVTYYATVIFVVFIVMGQLKISENIISLAFILIFGAFCLAGGLAFGLGGKEEAAALLKKLKEKKRSSKK